MRQSTGRLRNINFSDVEKYASKLTGCSTSTQKAYKYFAEPGYLHNIKGTFFLSCHQNYQNLGLYYLISKLIIEEKKVKHI